jgi:hypothetical protein
MGKLLLQTCTVCLTVHPEAVRSLIDLQLVFQTHVNLYRLYYEKWISYHQVQPPM